VAVDARVPPSELAALAAVADRLQRIAPIGWAAQAWSWLHRQCSGDWILRLDDDEACSPALLEVLPSLLERRDVRQYAIHRRWVSPDDASLLPSTDRQRRLYRNDAALYFSGRPGTGAEPCFPTRDVTEPILCLGALPRPEPLAPADSAGVPPVVPAEAVLRHWAGRELGAGAYRARVVPLSGPRVLRAGEQRPFHVMVHNEGDEPWPGGEGREPLIRPSYHWLDAAGATVVFDGLRTPLPAPLAPGGMCRMPVSVLAPTSPGEYELRFDVVHEGHRWFETPASLQPVTVRAA
jgi:hypothetical protein